MPTTKVYGCGGRYSFLNFFPCSSCISNNNFQDCEDILKNCKTQKHKEWCSDMIGRMWGKTPVEYYRWDESKQTWETVDINETNGITI